MAAPAAPLLGQVVAATVRRLDVRHVTPRARRTARHRERQAWQSAARAACARMKIVRTR